jgi:hypothetical protein
MWLWLRALLDPSARRASAGARRWFSTSHPEFRCRGVQLIAREAKRLVFRIRYQPSASTRGHEYMVVGVRGAGEVEAIDVNAHPQYRMRWPSV